MFWKLKIYLSKKIYTFTDDKIYDQKIKKDVILEITDSKIDCLDLLKINVIGFHFENIIARKIRLYDLRLTHVTNIRLSKINEFETALDVDCDEDILIVDTKIDKFSVEGSNFNCREFCIWYSEVGYLEVVNSFFKEKCKFLINSSSISISISDSYFYGEFVLLDPVIQSFIIKDVY